MSEQLVEDNVSRSLLNRPPTTHCKRRNRAFINLTKNSSYFTAAGVNDISPAGKGINRNGSHRCSAGSCSGSKNNQQNLRLGNAGPGDGSGRSGEGNGRRLTTCAGASSSAGRSAGADVRKSRNQVRVLNGWPASQQLRGRLSGTGLINSQNSVSVYKTSRYDTS